MISSSILKCFSFTFFKQYYTDAYWQNQYLGTHTLKVRPIGFANACWSIKSDMPPQFNLPWTIVGYLQGRWQKPSILKAGGYCAFRQARLYSLF